MLFTERMKKMELLILESDVDSVMRYLGFAGCVQLISDAHEERELSMQEREIAELRVKLDSLARFLGVEAGGRARSESPPLDRAELRARALSLMEEMRGLVEEESALFQRLLTLKQTAEELSEFSRLKVSLGDLDHLAYLTFRVGRVVPDKLDDLAMRLEKRALVLRLESPGRFLAVAPKKSRWAMDSELRKLDCQVTDLPERGNGIPAEMLVAVRADIANVEESLRVLEERKRAERDAKSEEIALLLDVLGLNVAIDTVKQSFAATGSVRKISGWLPRRRVREVAGKLASLTEGRFALRTFNPEELSEVKAGKMKVPVSTPHRRIVGSFERMVSSYSIPLYGTIDPTPFVAVIFVLLFAIMFGDVGQGFIGFSLGLLINIGNVKAFESYRRKRFGTIFMIAGIASMVTGFMYGSFFANENVLVPASRLVSRMIIGRPLDHIVSLVGFQKIIAFFGITIALGAVINSVGLAINIVNNIARRDWEKAILSKTGIAGALLFWYALAIALRLLLGGRIFGFDIFAIAIPLLALFVHEPLVHLASGHRPLVKDGLFSFVMEGIVEILESTIYHVSNSISFLRVAAFALAHTVLSTIVFLLAGMVGGAPGGMVFRILVILIGNSVIVVLEGLIVTIQVVRLQYYEFFSKFFNESGEEFRPFTLRTSGGLR